MAKTPNVWFMSDPHFGHRNMTEKFLMDDGVTRVRHEFQTMEECDEAIIRNCNEVIGQGDKVYCLGDFAFSSELVKKYRLRLNGNWSIILGNHDPADPEAWCWHMPDGRRAFQKVVSWKQFGPVGEKAIFTACHYPLHTMTLTTHHEKTFKMACVHGHEHRNMVMLTKPSKAEVISHADDAYTTREDPRYINICVENTGYAPLHYDDIVKIMKKRGLL